MTPIRISAKNLGHLSLPDFCPRCFWYQLKLGFRAPWSIFPGIFSSFDALQKNLVSLHWQTHRRLPSWLDGFGELGVPLPAPHHSKFKVAEESSGVLLTGSPDFMFRRPDETLAILDGKTARLTEGQDDLLPLYATQLNAYAYIAERLETGRVSLLGLIYFEPGTTVEGANLKKFTSESGYQMKFHAALKPVVLNPSSIPPLLTKVKETADLRDAPDGRAGCKDCRLTEQLTALLSARATSVLD
jgi:hypothetical protein